MAVFTGNKQFDSRVYNILDALELENSISVNDTNYDINKYYNINWDKVNKLLKEKREESLEILRDILDN